MPFFNRKKAEPDSDGFYATAIAPEAVGENEMVTARAGGEIAIISRSGGELVAFSNVCPHAAAD
ncbi:MAG: Rieske 2Fe-2S domain-containing protein, partial [Anaerolineae bacterium]|nr:Rieske 2Fe-2S domain-containing protein [Anaerolineae bacterium]